MALSRLRLARPVLVLLAFICALVLVDTVFFTALTPLLPYYTRAAGLSKAGAGLLVAAYPSVPWSARCRAGARRPAGRPAGRCCWGWR